jgi:hypothetical protein
MSEDEAPPPSVTFATGGLQWTRVRTPRLLSFIAKILFALGGLTVLAASYESMGFLAFAGLLGVLAWPLFIVSYILSLTQNAIGGGLEVSKSELVVHIARKRKTIAVDAIAGALVVERLGLGWPIPTVEIELTDGDILTARLPDPRSAHAVVSALGFGAGGRRVHAALAKPTRRLLHPMLGFLAYIVGNVAMVVASTVGGFGVAYAFCPLVALAAYAGLKRLTRAPELTVGDDGVLVEGRFRRTFIPRSDIVAVAMPTFTTLVIQRKSGKATIVRGVVLNDARCAAIARVIEDRLGPSVATADRFAHYDRSGRALSAWRDHLARAMNEASYRQNAATVDEAAAVLRSAEATPEQRVGAALALRVAGEPAERIRVAVDAAADDRVREALEAVAEARDGNDDPMIEKALRRLAAPD